MLWRRRRLSVLLAESSFERAELVHAAVRTPARIDALERAVAAYELEHARLLEGFGREAIVAVAARVAAGEQAPDDLQGVREQVEQLRAAAHRLTLREGERESVLRSLQALRGEYAAFRAQTAQRYDRAQMLANLAAAAAVTLWAVMSIRSIWSAMCWVPSLSVFCSRRRCIWTA